jgi:hypothetical protein
MFAASKTDGSSEVPDPQFNYVTMLLHGDGTNGAQNNTFLDSSTNNFTITRNGNTTQGSFSPYGSNWSNFFDGSGDYLTAPSTSGQLGSGNFTIECWSYLHSKVTNFPCIWGNYTLFTTGSLAIFAGHTSGDTSKYNIAINGTFPALQSTASIIYGQWTHLALVRNGSTITLYVNGVANGTASSSATLNGTSGVSYIGSAGDDLANGYINGYLSNLRVVVGTAVYTSAFTPPTAPLTAVTNTRLLTCADNRFIDDSTNNFTITAFGNTSVQRFNPFGASAAYSTSVIGGSGYFDGTDDYLSYSQQSYSGNFTFECWVYQIGASGSYPLFFASNTASVQIMIDYQGTGKLTFYTSSSTIQSASNVFQRNQWNHLAYVRNGSTITIYYNGTSVASGSLSDAIPISFIGGYTSSGYTLNGYISDSRITTSALYTTTFTPPIAPLTAISGTSLLLNYTNGAIFNNAMMNDLETAGNAQISTSVKKYGTGSIAFDGTGDYLRIQPSDLLATWFNSDFTIEYWVYPNAFASSVNGGSNVYSQSNPASTSEYWSFGPRASGEVVWYYYSGSIQRVTSGTISTGVWTHLAWTYQKSSNTIRIFINGVLNTTTTIVGTPSITTTVDPILVGASTTVGFNGYIDDLRITKGIARYTSNFTPPIAAFPNIGPV